MSGRDYWRAGRSTTGSPGRSLIVHAAAAVGAGAALAVLGSGIDTGIAATWTLSALRQPAPDHEPDARGMTAGWVRSRSPPAGEMGHADSDLGPTHGGKLT